MTKLYAEVYKLKAGAEHAAHVARSYGQFDAADQWMCRGDAYAVVLAMLGDPEITPAIWKRIVCKIFHQKSSLKCPSCGGSF